MRGMACERPQHLLAPVLRVPIYALIVLLWLTCWALVDMVLSWQARGRPPGGAESLELTTWLILLEGTVLLWLHDLARTVVRPWERLVILASGTAGVGWFVNVSVAALFR